MEDLRNAIVNRNLSDLLDELFFERAPYSFSDSWEKYRGWRHVLGKAISVDPCEIVIIGSSAVGYSLSPDSPLKPFDSESDIDVAIVSDYYFSEAWHFLRNVDITLDSLTPAQRNAVIAHQKRYVYWGCITTDRLLPIMPFARSWLSARAVLANLSPTVGRDIRFRVYKDFDALRGYQLRGLQKIRDSILSLQGDSDAAVSEHDNT
jgi:hypothetical protein